MAPRSPFGSLRAPSALAIALLAGCKGQDPVETDDTDVVVIDTGRPPDTDTDLPVETDVIDTEVPVDTADTDDTDLPPPVWTNITLSPDGLWVSVGANVGYRLRATSPEGLRTTPEIVTWSVDDHPEVCAVLDGTATALTPGDCTVTATFDGGSASAVLHVQDAGQIEVTVIDADTGAAIGTAGVQVNDTRLVDTDAYGLSSGDGVPADPQVVCAFEAGYVPACVGPIVGRRLVVPLRPEGDDVTGDVVGTADSHALSTQVNEFGVGIVVASFAGSPWWANLSDLLGENRTVSVLGIDVDLPSNVFVQGNAEDFTYPTPVGDRDLWGFAVPLPIADALAVANGNSDPITVLGAHVADGVHGVTGPFNVPDTGYDAGTFVLANPLQDTVDTVTPALPLGTDGNETPLLLAMQDLAEGATPNGLAVASGSVAIPADGPSDRVLAIVQAGGFGSGRGQSVSVGDVIGTTAELPAFLEIGGLPVVHVTNHDIELSTDPNASVVQIRITEHANVRDLYVPAGTQDVYWPTLPPVIGLGDTFFTIHTVAVDVSTFESLAQTGSLDRSGVEPELTGVSFVDGEVVGTIP